MESQEIRRRLELILGDKVTLEKSAGATFRQFDKNKDGILTFEELRALVDRLIGNLKLPPIDDRTLSRIAQKYDVDSAESHLSEVEFAKLYADLLILVKDKYYPTKKITSRRDLFVGKRKLTESQKFEDLFTPGKRLGAGSFGEVRIVVDSANKLTRVCKTVSKGRCDLPQEQIAAEIDCMVALDHPNIIKIYEVLEDKHNVYIIMEQCEGGEIMSVISNRQKRTERQVAGWIRQITEAIAYSHDHNIVHKDLKPENAMFLTKGTDSIVKVIDFGVAECFRPAQRYSDQVAGTPLYLAPEEFSSGICGRKVDCWAIGCICYLLLTGKFPFYGNSQSQLKQRVLKAEPNYESECRHISPLAVDFLKRTLTKDPRRRASAREMLAHEWFSIAATVNKTISVDVCDNLKTYVRQNEAKSALLNFLVHQMPCSSTQITQLQQIFKSIDKNDQGYLATPEFEKALVKAGLPQHEARRVVDSLENPDEPGVVHYTTFLAACFDYENMQTEIVWSAFNKLDRDGSGAITVQEFTNVLMGDASNLMSRKEIESFVKEIDASGNGLIEWSEFEASMKKKQTT